VINDGPRTVQVEKDQTDCPIFGKKIGDTISGEFLGLSGFELKITGGSDKDGFPMRIDVEGVPRKRIIVIEGVGFSGSFKGKKKEKRFHRGARKRKSIRGNTVAADIVQLNCSVVKRGDKPAADVLGIKPKDAPAEQTTEAPVEERKE